MPPSPNMSNEWELELNSMLANASNSFIINQRAVDDGKITWEAREQMFANILRNFREFLNSLLSSERAEIKRIVEGMYPQITNGAGDEYVKKLDVLSALEK